MRQMIKSKSIPKNETLFPFLIQIPLFLLENPLYFVSPFFAGVFRRETTLELVAFLAQKVEIFIERSEIRFFGES